MESRSAKAKTSGKKEPTNAFGIITILALFGGVIYCLYLIQDKELTSRESGLLALVLTMFSILATWLASYWYSKSQYQNAIVEVKELHDENLRTYALKAAEKVTNLSNELVRLSVYLEEVLEENEPRSIDIALLSAQERITSAVHIVNTLKSVNDTALSDWQGVIGEQLDKQREELREKEENLREIVLETVDALRQGGTYFTDSVYNSDDIHSTLNSLNSELRAAIKQLSGVTILPKPTTRPGRNVVKSTCPNCKLQVAYKQRPIPKGTKPVKCKACHAELISRFENDCFSLDLRRLINEEVSCPRCEANNGIEIDNAPGSVVISKCKQCGELFRASRSSTSQIFLKPYNANHPPAKRDSEFENHDSSAQNVEMSEDLIRKVKECMPPQPWPDGTHKSVAETLGISHRQVGRAVWILTRRGELMPQIDGVVFFPKK